MITELVPFAEYINGGNLQHCSIRATALNGATITLGDDDVKMGGFQYDARSTSGDVLELGSTIAAQLTLQLIAAGDADNFNWYGARLEVQVGVEAESTIVYGNLGVFVVDEADRRYDTWNITALDNLVRFDKTLTAANWNTINLGGWTVGDIISKASAASGVSVGVLDDLLNSGVTLPTVTPQENATWRNILQWCGEFAGVCFYCDGIGRLCCKWYELPQTATAANTISYEKRYRSNISYNDVTLTGVVVNIDVDGETKEYTYGTDGYQIQIENNPLFTPDNVQAAVNNIGARLSGFSYAPFDASCVPFFYLNALDGCYITENISGANITSIITHTAFALNGATDIEAVGKSIQSKSYANASAFTRQQAVIVDTVKEQMTAYVNERELALQGLNALMANAMGLQFTTINGIWYAYYSPDNTGIENARIIYMLTNQGLAWATSWNSGDPQWVYGITAEGNAILNQIYVTGITVDDGKEPFVTKILPKAWQLLHNGTALITASGETGEGILKLDKVQMTEDGYIRLGKARMYGTSSGMDIVIED